MGHTHLQHRQNCTRDVHSVLSPTFPTSVVSTWARQNKSSYQITQPHSMHQPESMQDHGLSYSFGQLTKRQNRGSRGVRAKARQCFQAIGKQSNLFALELGKGQTTHSDLTGNCFMWYPILLSMHRDDFDVPMITFPWSCPRQTCKSKAYQSLCMSSYDFIGPLFPKTRLKNNHFPLSKSVDNATKQHICEAVSTLWQGLCSNCQLPEVMQSADGPQ